MASQAASGPLSASGFVTCEALNPREIAVLASLRDLFALSLVEEVRLVCLCAGMGSGVGRKLGSCRGFPESLSTAVGWMVHGFLPLTSVRLGCRFDARCPPQNMGDFLEHGLLDASAGALVRREVRQLCAELRPEAISLTDAWQFTDKFLSSAIGKSDG